jgi:hypothetical protein
VRRWEGERVCVVGTCPPYASRAGVLRGRCECWARRGACVKARGVIRPTDSVSSHPGVVDLRGGAAGVGPRLDAAHCQMTATRVVTLSISQPLPFVWQAWVSGVAQHGVTGGFGESQGPGHRTSLRQLLPRLASPWRFVPLTHRLNQSKSVTGNQSGTQEQGAHRGDSS